MEAAGVAQAGHLNDALPTIMVRGVSDYADKSKSAADDAGWQARAVTNAAAFAASLAAVLAAELDEGRRPPSRSRADGTGHGGPTNIALGNARVGVQGQSVTVHGGIQLGGPDSGRGTAGLAVRTGMPAIRPGRLRLALNWARGVLRGIAGLAAGITAIMTAVRSVT